VRLSPSVLAPHGCAPPYRDLVGGRCTRNRPPTRDMTNGDDLVRSRGASLRQIRMAIRPILGEIGVGKICTAVPTPEQVRGGGSIRVQGIKEPLELVGAPAVARHVGQ
jgi:hypothetical protein